MKPDIKYVFLIDVNGKYTNEKENIRFNKIEGEELKRFYNEGKDKTKNICYFQIEETKYSFGIETTKEKLKSINKENNHEKYLEDCKKPKKKKKKSEDKAKPSNVNESESSETDENNTQVITEEFADAEFFYQFADETVNVEQDAIKRVQITNLRKALSMLSYDEREIIKKLYLNKPPLTLKQLAKITGTSVSNLHNKKKKILSKMLNFGIL